MGITKNIYFKGLNGIRALAALIVVIWHIGQNSTLLNIDSVGFNKNGMAGNAVLMFFVLSGFLITYLLLIEKERTKSIDIKSFYLRRIFRIWPLYYLSIIISIILIYLDIIPPPEDLSTSLILYIFLLANVAYGLKITLSSITPLWSVGAEEQFYLIWPVIVKKTSNYLLTFASLILLYLITKLVVYITLTPKSMVYMVISKTNIDIMCIGAIGAYLVYSKNKILKVLYRKEIQLISWGILITSIFYKPIHIYSFIDGELNSIFYLIIILNVSTNKDTIISLENKFFNFIGRISYGIYIYHMIVIYIVSYQLKCLGLKLDIIIVHLLVLLLTILTSWISYEYFEKPFLNMKSKYTIVTSSNSSN